MADRPNNARPPRHVGVCTILPPYLLEQVVLHGSREERASAELTLIHSQSLRTGRGIAGQSAPGATGLSGSSRVRVYDAGGSTTTPGELARDDGDPVTGD